MHTRHERRRATRAIGVVALATILLATFVGVSGASADETPTTPSPSPTETTEPPATPATPSPDPDDTPEPDSVVEPQAVSPSAYEPPKPPYSNKYPITVETNFTRPFRSISSYKNSDFTQLNEIERIIRGSYQKPDGKLRSKSYREKSFVYMSISRMENAYRNSVRGALDDAARYGVKVRVIHGVASQSVESRWLQSRLNNSGYRNSHFRICEQGKSLACLSDLNGAIMHSKILLVGNTGSTKGSFATYTQDGTPAKNAIWTGSANLGGPSGQQTFNNGLTVYNDQMLWNQMNRLWKDMYAERDVNNDMISHIRKNKTQYGYSKGYQEGYTSDYAKYGMFYSNRSNVTIYPTPIKATPISGTDPVMMMLNRVIPTDQCRIRLQENRMKYRRIAVAHKLVELSDKGCKVEAITFRDDLERNRIIHCQQWMRICKPILDVFKTSSRHINAAWAKPHDKTIMVEALMGPNKLNRFEIPPDADPRPIGDQPLWPNSESEGATCVSGRCGVWTTMVQAGSAALTGSNLIVSDEIMVETTDPLVYADYLEHWDAIWRSYEQKDWNY